MTLRPLLLGAVLSLCVGGAALAAPGSGSAGSPVPAASPSPGDPTARPALVVPGVTAPSAGTFTLEESLAIGLRQNPNVKVADERVATAAAQYGQQQSQKNLQFVFSDKTTGQEKRSSKFGPLVVPTTDSIASQIQASLQVLLTTFGKVENEIAAAFLQIGVEAENARTTRLDLNYQIKQSFFQRLKADASVEVATMNLDVGRQSLSDTDKLFAQGIMARYDVVQADLQVTEATEQLARAQNDVLVSSANFLTVLNEPIGRSVTLVAPHPIAVDPAVTVEELQAVALVHRPEILSLGRSLEVARTLLDAAYSESLPNVSLSADYVTAPGYHTIPQNQYQLNLLVNWALWDGGYRDGKVDEARSQIRSIESSGEDLRNNVRLQVETAWLDFQLATVTLGTSRKRVDAAEVYYDMARQRFLNGLGTSLEVQDALRKLNEARQNLVVASYDRDLAFAAIENSIGVDFPDRHLAVTPEMLPEGGR